MALSRNERITLIAALISSPLFTFVIDFFRSVPIFSTIKAAYHWTIDLLILILTFDVQLWIVVLILTLIIVALGIYGNMGSNKLKARQFNFLDYTTDDNIAGFKWSWSYEFNSEKKRYIISEVKAYCPSCDSPLRPKNVFLNEYTECIRCDYEKPGNVYSDMHRIESLIIDNITRMSRANISGS